MLSKQEKAYYSRQILLDEIGEKGQLALKNAKVLVIGAGGLGSPLLLQLATAGVGHIGIADADVVNTHNLHRQTLFTLEDIGKNKAEAAKIALLKHNNLIDIQSFNYHIAAANAEALMAKYDIVCDATDNFATRYLINDACVLFNKINVFASISGYKGRVAVFNDEAGINYRDMYPVAPIADSFPNCAENGVLGVLTQLTASVQAAEVLKIITKIGQPLSGKLWEYDMLTNASICLSITKDTSLKAITHLPTVDISCDTDEVKELSLAEAEQHFGKGFLLVDVREPHEHEAKNIGGLLLPPGEILKRHKEIPDNEPVVLYCKTGFRSSVAIRRLQQTYGYGNLYNLKGGLASLSI